MIYKYMSVLIYRRSWRCYWKAPNMIEKYKGQDDTCLFFFFFLPYTCRRLRSLSHLFIFFLNTIFLCLYTFPLVLYLSTKQVSKFDYRLETTDKFFMDNFARIKYWKNKNRLKNVKLFFISFSIGLFLWQLGDSLVSPSFHNEKLSFYFFHFFVTFYFIFKFLKKFLSSIFFYLIFIFYIYILLFLFLYIFLWQNFSTNPLYQDV